MRMIEFARAEIVYGDTPKDVKYEARHKIMIAANQIVAAYDHMIITTEGTRFRVMETYEEIREKIEADLYKFHIMGAI